MTVQTMNGSKLQEYSEQVPWKGAPWIRGTEGPEAPRCVVRLPTSPGGKHEKKAPIKGAST